MSYISRGNRTNTRSECYQSRHIVEIIEAYEEIQRTVEEQEEELNKFVQRTQTLSRDEYHDILEEDKEEESNERTYTVVN